MLSFGTRTVGDATIIDWSMRGGSGCRPATRAEVELLARIATLEEALRPFARDHSETKVTRLDYERARKALEASSK